MIDRDLAELYGVTTGNLNKAVARNISRFPSDFMFELSAEEWKRLDNLLFQNGIPRHGGSRYAPHAFTEHGIVVLANILKSDIAINMSILITRALPERLRLRCLDLCLILDQERKARDYTYRQLY